MRNVDSDRDYNSLCKSSDSMAYLFCLCDHSGNKRADALAKAATEIIPLPPEIPILPTPVASWTKEWRRQLQRPSTFLQANRFSPALKPREHLSHTPRNLYGQIIQCRTCHAFMDE